MQHWFYYNSVCSIHFDDINRSSCVDFCHALCYFGRSIY
jgi:hypothetical protein